jgi:hypothetical protein
MCCQGWSRVAAQIHCVAFLLNAKRTGVNRKSLPGYPLQPCLRCRRRLGPVESRVTEARSPQQ